MRKRILALLVSVLMSFSIVANAYAETDPCSAFTDVDRSAWYHTALDYVLKNGLMSGMSDTKFAPKSNVSRAMVVQTFYAIEGKPEVKGTAPFSDVEQSSWYCDAVNWAAKNGVAAGFSNGTFRPSAPVTREQLAVFFKAFAGFQGKNTTGRTDITGYTDYSGISLYAQSSISWAVQVGFMTGRGSASVAPKGTAMRAELAQMLYRYAEKKSYSNSSNRTDRSCENRLFNNRIISMEAGDAYPLTISKDKGKYGLVVWNVGEKENVATVKGNVIYGVSPGCVVICYAMEDGQRGEILTGLYVNGNITEDSAYDDLNEFRTRSNNWVWNQDNSTKTYYNTNSGNSLRKLTRNGDLETAAKIRAKEVMDKFEHTRPNGTKYRTLYPSNVSSVGENIYKGSGWFGEIVPNGNIIPSIEATGSFIEENYDYSGQAHRRNMLRPDLNSVGIAGYYYEGTTTWVQSFAHVN